MASTLDKSEESMRNEIKRIANRFNDVNKLTRNTKEWILAAKKAVEVTGRNVATGKRNVESLRNLSVSRLKESVERVKMVAKDDTIFRNEIDRVMIILQEIQRTTLLPMQTRLNAMWATRLVQTEAGVTGRLRTCNVLISQIQQSLPMLRV